MKLTVTLQNMIHFSVKIIIFCIQVKEKNEISKAQPIHIKNHCHNTSTL